jgi:hypothetical protein
MDHVCITVACAFAQFDWVSLRLGTILCQVILLHPPVISYSATKRLAPFLESLETMGLPVRVRSVGVSHMFNW